METEVKPVMDADQLSEQEKARHLRLLELRQRLSGTSGEAQTPAEETPQTVDGPPAAGDGAGAGGAAAHPTGGAGAREAAAGAGAADAGANQGEELNDFLKQLVERRKARHFQLQLIQDFFENPVEFGVEVDYVPSETPLVEIRTRQKELRYRITLLRTVLEAFEGELALLDQAERSALASGGAEQPPPAGTDTAAAPGPRADDAGGRDA